MRAIVDFIAKHPNITGGITFHTWSGVLLRPYSHQPDDAFPAEDLWAYQKIGAKGTEITGYPNVSVYHDFKYHPKEYISGVFDDWMYDHLGVFAWTVEIWSPQRQAGITDYKFIDWYREHPVEDDLKLLKWSDEVLGGKGYVDWYEFDHPQAGQSGFGRLGCAVCVAQPTPTVSGERGGAVPRLAGVAPADFAETGDLRGEGDATGRPPLSGAARGAEHRLAAYLHHQKGAGEEGGARRDCRD